MWIRFPQGKLINLALVVQVDPPRDSGGSWYVDFLVAGNYIPAKFDEELLAQSFFDAVAARVLQVGSPSSEKVEIKLDVDPRLNPPKPGPIDGPNYEVRIVSVDELVGGACPVCRERLERCACARP